MASLPYPRRPPNSFHRTHSKFVCASPPTEFTEVSGGGYSPTDFTDVHRFFFSASCFCVFREFCGKIVCWLRGYGRMPYPRCPPNSFHRTHSKFACASPPTEFTEYTEASGVEEPPTDAHRCTQMVRLRRVLPQNSQNTQKLQAEDILPRISQNTQKLLAEKSLPQMRTDAHRWLGYVGFSHGFHRIHRSFWRRRASHRCAQMYTDFSSPPSFLCVCILWEDSLVAAWVWQDAIPS